MLYRSLRVVVTDWGNRRGRIFFPTGFAPSVAVHPRGYTTLRHHGGRGVHAAQDPRQRRDTGRRGSRPYGVSASLTHHFTKRIGG